jgi:formylglycine-generating enzyme required for sulfatase activity
VRSSIRNVVRGLGLTLVLGGCSAIVGIGEIPTPAEGGPPDATFGVDTGASSGSSSGSGSGSGADSMADGSEDSSVDAPDSSDSESDASRSGDGSDGSSSDGSSSGGEAGPTPPSCQPGGAGMTNCGAAGNDDCCTSLEVTGGTYHRTFSYAADGGGPSGLADLATISNFRLDKYDVTVGRFRQFVEAVLPPDGGAGWMPAAGSGKHAHLYGGSGLVNNGSDAGFVYETGWNTADNALVAPTNSNLLTSTYLAGPCDWTASPGGNENLPINCVTWQEAFAFCIWDGGFLPSEAEWGYAAAGGSELREYAWGGAPAGSSNQYAIIDCDYPSGAGTCSGGVGTVANIAPVGTATSGAGKWGQLDLLGEMYQFNIDFAAGSWNYPNPCTDCTTQRRGGLVRYGFRGGNYGTLVHSYDRNDDWPARSFAVGFRCARTP